MRAAGYAWGLEEFAEGIDSVAAPIRDARGHAIAALHVHGPSYRFPVRGDEARVAVPSPPQPRRSVGYSVATTADSLRSGAS